MSRLLSALVLGLLAGCQPLLNTLTPSGGYGVASDVSYESTKRLRLDVYKPDNARNAPVVVFFYGGRWTQGSKNDYRFVGEALASRGMVAIVPDIRRYPETRFAGFMQDAANAVVWAEKRAAGYGGDPKRIFVMGHSSGAHLAAMLAFNPDYLKAAGGERKRLRGLVGLAGAYDFLPILAPDLRDMFGPPERFELSQPVTFVDADSPPMLLLHGLDDDTVPVANTESLAAVAAQRGVAVEKVIYQKMTHAWMVASLSSALRSRNDVLDQVAGFVRRRSAEAPRPAAVETRPRP